MESKIVQNGLFEVFENGDIYRITKNGKKKASQIKTSRNGAYLSVTAYVDGKQKHYYSHRLIAEAFIPNPDNKKIVRHKDGDGLNNTIDNLEWVNREEIQPIMIKYLERERLKRRNPCKSCGEPTLAKDEICSDCKKEQIQELRSSITKEARKESVSYIDLDYVTEKQREAVVLRRQGKTFQEIAEILNITRQAVGNRLKEADRRALVGKPLKTKLKQLQTLKEQLSKKEAKVELYKLQIKQLEEELN